MREILFRGKRIDNDEWVEGALFQCDDGTMYIATSMLSPPEDGGPAMVACRMVYGNTVGQYTGLTDKNGKMIFEGDIVFNNMTGRKLIGYLEERAAFCFCDKCITSPAFIGQYNFEYFEVIGNIYDNPELLEVGE